MTEIVQPFHPRAVNQVRFSVAAHAAWAPGRETPAAWAHWAGVAPGTAASAAGHDKPADPALQAMPPMLRRRASPTGKLALQAAYDAQAAYMAGLPDAVGTERPDIPTIFCSRHGECERSADLLADLARQLPLSPTAFSLSVHNATGGLFSIARRDHGNCLALAAGRSTVEHAAIEACSLLADGAPAVLLVVSDGPLPPMYRQFADCDEQPFGWAWLLRTAEADAGADTVSLRWEVHAEDAAEDRAGGGNHDDDGDNEPQRATEPGGLQIMRFFLRGDAILQRHADDRLWTWSRNES